MRTQGIADTVNESKAEMQGIADAARTALSEVTAGYLKQMNTDHAALTTTASERPTMHTHAHTCTRALAGSRQWLAHEQSYEHMARGRVATTCMSTNPNDDGCPDNDTHGSVHHRRPRKRSRRCPTASGKPSRTSRPVRWVLCVAGPCTVGQHTGWLHTAWRAGVRRCSVRAVLVLKLALGASQGPWFSAKPR